MNSVFKWIVTHITGWLHSISSADLINAIDLVVKAQSVSTNRSEKLQWFADQFSKLNASLQLWHEDGEPTNTLLLLVGLAKDLAIKFGLIKV